MVSTTRHKAVAMSYAAGAGGVGFVFEIHQGMVDRGADVGFLSQYPQSAAEGRTEANVSMLLPHAALHFTSESSRFVT